MIVWALTRSDGKNTSPLRHSSTRTAPSPRLSWYQARVVSMSRHRSTRWSKAVTVTAGAVVAVSVMVVLNLGGENLGGERQCRSRQLNDGRRRTDGWGCSTKRHPASSGASLRGSTKVRCVTGLVLVIALLLATLYLDSKIHEEKS